MKVPVSATMSVRMEQEVVKLLPETTSRMWKVRGTKNAGDINGVGTINIHGVKEGEQPLVIVDGKEALEKDALSRIAPDHIKSITILKDKSATAVYGEKGKDGVIIVTLLTEGEYEFKKANPEKPYADALELAESAARGVEGKIIYCIDDKEVKKTELKGMSTKAIRSVSVDNAGEEKIVRLKTDKYRSNWITVTGVVYNEDGKTIPADVNVKGTSFFERADANGCFTIKAPKNGVLRVGSHSKPIIEVKVKPTVKIVLKDK